MLLVVYRHFGTAHWYNLQLSSSQRRLSRQFKVATTDSPQTSATNTQTHCVKTPKREDLLYIEGGNLKSHTKYFICFLCLSYLLYLPPIYSLISSNQ